MNNLMYRLSAGIQVLISSEEGQDLVEYALLIALISLAAITGLNTLAKDIGNVFTTVGGRLTSAIA